MTGSAMQAREHLCAIRDAPGDEDELLAYATWLEGQGDPLGEFIRVQCALAVGARGGDAQAELVAREATLRAAHEQE